MIFRPRKSDFSVFGGTEGGLQWSRDLSTTEIFNWTRLQFRRFGFNGAVIFRPRKLHSSICAPATYACFNGAVIFRPRKSSWQTLTTAILITGFNGAVIFRPRKSVAAGPKGSPPWGFNGAVIFRPRKYQQQELLTRLSWGFNGAVIFRPRKFS